MGGQRHFVDVLLVSVSILIIIGAAGATTAAGVGPLATIHVKNAMGKGSAPLQIHCESDYKTYCGVKGVGVGEDYECGVEEKALYYCAATSARQFATWHAFQPRRDGNHKAVFWLLNPQGVFLSWDNSTWVKKTIWLNE